MLAICLCGPESTGKTTLARALSEHFKLPYVAEYARGWLTERGKEATYTEEDLLTLARAQWSEEKNALRLDGRAILDTDLLNIRLWSQIKYGRCHPWILERSAKVQDKIYLLTTPDIAFVQDVLREGHDRSALYLQWQNLLRQVGACYRPVSGQGQARVQSAISLVAANNADSS